MDALVVVFGEIIALGMADGPAERVEFAVRLLHGSAQAVQGATTFTFGFGHVRYTGAE